MTTQEMPPVTPPKWEYKADNLKKIPGMALEGQFNKRGQEGWEFVAECDGYAIFKRKAGG